jgi:hypothetical protein
MDSTIEEARYLEILERNRKLIEEESKKEES